MIITISGPPGSGKSTVAVLLAKRMRFRHLSAGEMFRQLAKEEGMSLEVFGTEAETCFDIDKKLDETIVKMAKGDVVIEGRIAGWMVLRNGIDALKVYIDASRTVRAHRISGREKESVEVSMKKIEEREICEWRRYNDIYGIDLLGMSIYDLKIDSGNKTPDEIVEIICEAAKKWKHV